MSLDFLTTYVSARSRREPPQHGARGECWLWLHACAVAPAPAGQKKRPVAKIDKIADGKTFCVRTELLCEKNNWRRKPADVVAVTTCGRELCVNPDHVVPGRLLVMTKAVPS